ncbi:ANKRD50, partial [Symbiodinium sp. CCMP2456]
LLQVAGADITVYTSEKVQCEWVAVEALRLFWRTQKDSKRLQAFRSARQNIRDYHRMIWPGFKVPEREPKQNPFSKGRADVDQEAWFRERTMTTSVLLATAAYSIHFKYRVPKDRDKACKGFAKLLSMLASTLGGFELELDRFGDDQRVDVAVDFGGRVSGHDFWTTEFYDEHIADSWEADRRDAAKPWISSASGLEHVSLAELLCFALDPQHTTAIQDSLLCRVFNMMSEIAEYLDSLCSKAQREADFLTDAQQTKNQKRQKHHVVSVLVEQVARKLWEGTVACPVHL